MYSIFDLKNKALLFVYVMSWLLLNKTPFMQSHEPHLNKTLFLVYETRQLENTMFLKALSTGKN